MKLVFCDFLAPPEVIKKYTTKNKEPVNDKEKSSWAPYSFDLNKVVKLSDKAKKRTAKACSGIRIWGTKENVTESGYIPGSDSVSFVCKDKCPDVAIKKIFAENPGIYMRFYWFREGEDKEHYYIRNLAGKIMIKNGEGVLKKSH